MDEKEKSQENVAPEVQAEQVDSESKNNGVEADSEMTRKVIFSLCYLWGILFFIPLLMYKGDAKATRHANEGLLLLLFSVVGNIQAQCSVAVLILLQHCHHVQTKC